MKNNAQEAIDMSATRRMSSSEECEQVRHHGLPYNAWAGQAGAGPDQRPLPESRVSYLKVLVTSLLREIEALEGYSKEHGHENATLQGEVRRFEAELIRSALMKTGGRQRRAARLLGTKVTTLNAKIKRYRIRIDDPSTDSESLQRPAQVSILATQFTPVPVSESEERYYSAR